LKPTSLQFFIIKRDCVKIAAANLKKKETKVNSSTTAVVVTKIKEKTGVL
jgi:hypothetical protein